MINIKQVIKSRTFEEYMRYIVVGGVAFIIDYSILLLMTGVLNINYLLSAGISFIIGSVVNYILSIKTVFKKRSINKKEAEFLIFIILGISGLLLNEVIMWTGTELFSFQYYATKILSAGLVFTWNFGLRKIILFK